LWDFILALYLEANELKGKLDDMDVQAEEQLKRMKNEVHMINWQIFQLMYRFQQLDVANRQILEAGDRQRILSQSEYYYMVNRLETYRYHF